MKLVTYSQKNDMRLMSGVLIEDRVHGYTWNDNVQSLIERNIRTIVPTHESKSAAEVAFKVPFRPGKIVAVGRNYAAHAAELNNEVPKEPLLFAKLTSSLLDPNGVITWDSSLTSQVDWEGELAVIIGKTARNVREDQAYDYVYGYTIANDISARDLQDNDDQWIRAKGLDTFCPFGPYIATRDEIPDPHDLTVTTAVNGDVMQNASTSLMIYKIPYLVAYCSRAFTLHPGDVILTGTPSGVGKAQKPPRFLQDGDEVTVSITGLGSLTNRCAVSST
ncbi:MAG: fumarylacetoacetate hydrolase family protein [Anaerolineae bacterium]